MRFFMMYATSPKIGPLVNKLQPCVVKCETRSLRFFFSGLCSTCSVQVCAVTNALKQYIYFIRAGCPGRGLNDPPARVHIKGVQRATTSYCVQVVRLVTVSSGAAFLRAKRSEVGLGRLCVMVLGSSVYKLNRKVVKNRLSNFN